MNKDILLLIKKAIAWMICIVITVTLASCNNEPERAESNMENISKVYIVPPEVAKGLYPADYNLEMAIEKGLVSTSIYEARFLLLQSGYRAIFNAYLCECVNLDEYQNCLDAYELGFPKSSRTEYSEIGAFGRNNIFIRNSLYVERLSNEDIELILDAIDGEIIRIDDRLLSVVERTWREVVVVRLDQDTNGEPYEIVYDEDGINKISAFNDSLVLELAYGAEFDTSGNIVSKENEKTKYEYAADLANRMESEISNELNCHVSVIIKE